MAEHKLRLQAHIQFVFTLPVDAIPCRLLDKHLEPAALCVHLELLQQVPATAVHAAQCSAKWIARTLIFPTHAAYDLGCGFPYVELLAAGSRGNQDSALASGT